MADKTFDLLDSHNLGKSASIVQENILKEKPHDVLRWMKLHPKGHLPAAREGHSSISNNSKVYTFGGIESNTRTNTTYKLDLLSNTWSLILSNGKIPSARSNHAACFYKNLMIVHGGEAFVEDFCPVKVHTSKDFGLSGSGICPGDTISSKLRPSKKVSMISSVSDKASQSSNIATKHHLPSIDARIDPSAPLRCLEDMYGFDIVTEEWKLLPGVLGPLPRKGHTITLANIYGQPHFILFGGYSRDNDICSNSIHACVAEDVIGCYNSESVGTNTPLSPGGTIVALSKSNAFANPLVSISNSDNNNNTGSAKLPVVTWRTIIPAGKAPPGRYHHSATHVQGASGENYLVIFGGIGKDEKILSDIHILDLHTFTWIEPRYGNNALEQRVNGEGPPLPGVYGHSAIAARDNVGDSSPFKTKLLIFGGTTSRQPTLGSIHNTYCFDMISHMWFKIDTGHQFPAQRFGHSIAAAEGWTTLYSCPSDHPESSINANETASLVKASELNRVCAVMFGGRSESMSLHDTWALDLHWRPYGIDRFDGNSEEKVRNAMESLYSSDSSDIINHYPSKVGAVQQGSYRRYSKFKPSISLVELNARQPVLGVPISPTRTSTLKSNHTDSLPSYDSYRHGEEHASSLLQAKRERAQADVLLKNELVKASHTDQVIQELQDEVTILREKVLEMEISHRQESMRIQQELDASQQREQNLQELNREAYDLLILHGFQAL